MKLYIANKNYSSWSMRPWLAMTAKEIAFEEILTQFDDEAGNPLFREFSPTGKVPVLVDGAITICESLAILEYLAEKFPQADLWPADVAMRALARSHASEMHSGFAALRNACPMNMHRKPAPIAADPAVSRDVARIERIWAECLERSGGPFLFGAFTNADAMFAPVVSRIEKYLLSRDAAVAAYTSAMRGLDAWKKWEQAALAETWIIPSDEV
jgi:glutathione S-transferase